MARAAKTKVEAEPEDNGYPIADRDPNWRHEGFVTWVKRELDEDVDARDVQLAWALRNDYRDSDIYAELKAENVRSADEEEKPKPARKRGAKAAAESEPEAEAEPEAKQPARKARTRKAAAKTAEAKPAARRGRRTAATKAAATETDDAPF